MNRTTTRLSGDRIGQGLTYGVIDKVNDEPFMQQLGVKIRGAEAPTDIDHVYPFGFSAVPMGRTTDAQAKAGMMKGVAEIMVGALMGNRGDSVAFPASDRRFKINGLKAGETANFDAYKQMLHFGQDALTAESPKKVVHRVAVEKKQDDGQSGGSGSGSQQKKRNSGADVAAEKDVKVAVEMDEAGTYTVTAGGAGTITCKTLTLVAGGCKIKMADGKIVLEGEIHLGADGGKRVGMVGTLDSDNDALVESGSATKVFAT